MSLSNLFRTIFSLLLSGIVSLQLGYCQNIPSYVPQNGLLGWWPFDGNANDESGNGNNGISTNMVWGANRFGNTNSAADFSGIASRSIIVQNPSPVISNKKTFSAWIKLPVAYSSGLYFNNIITAYSGSNWLYYQVLGFHPSYIANGWTNRLSVQGSAPLTNTTLNTNTWHHVLAIFDGDSNKFYQYVNGTFEGSGLFNASPNFTNWAELTFGRGPNFFSESIFAGQIDDIGIWNKALSACEIQALYTGQLDTLNSGIDLFIDSNLSDCFTDTYHLFSLNGPVLWSNGDFGVSTIVNSQGWIGARKT